MRIKKGDKVIILSGRDKGKTGAVNVILPRLDKVIVDGVNIQKRHKKPGSNNQKGGIIEDSHPIPASKVAIIRPGKKALGSRIGLTIKADGTKVRVYRQAGNKEFK
jgi:large subunit ribosomal protein L24